MTTENTSNEIQIIRLYDASVKAVWDAWTDPNKAAKWWGPRGFTITTHSKDLCVGGHWRYTMHGPDGVDYPNHTKYFEVEPLRRLVYDHGGNDTQPPMFRVRVNFTDINGKTRMDMTMILPSPEAASETKKFIKKAGGNATWDRLAEFLKKESSDNEIFVINRTFDAPIDLMFEMWTDPQKLSKWLAPTGASMDFIRADIRPGGESFYCMTAPGDRKLYGRTHYIEIQKPARVIYTQQFTDKDGGISRHPLAPTWPETMRTTVTFIEESSRQTRVTVVWEIHGKCTNEELHTFVDGRTSMTGGWTGSFDKLEETLEVIS